MWECPDFFALDGRQVLLTSPQEMQATPDGVFHAGYGTVALLGDYDEQTHSFTRRSVQPVREIEGLWQDDMRLTGVRVAGKTALPGICGRRIDLTVTLHADGDSCRRFELRFAQDARCFTVIRCALSRGELVFDRTNCGSTRDIPHVRTIRAGAKDGVMKLRLILDGESAELFVNDGEHVISALLDTPMEAQGITLYADGELTADVEKHALG